MLRYRAFAEIFFLGFFEAVLVDGSVLVFVFFEEAVFLTSLECLNLSIVRFFGLLLIGDTIFT